MKYEIKTIGEELEIIYNGKVYGNWNNEANLNCPEDLIIGRELNSLIDIGIEIGKQIHKDENSCAFCKEFQIDLFPYPPNIVKNWAKCCRLCYNELMTR